MYDGPRALNPLRPDRLGEALVARVLRDQDDDGRAMLGRLLQTAGFRMIGIDRSPRLARAAAAASPAVPVLLADAASLPIAGESISLVVASMSLHDIDDFTAAIGEASRVLKPGGQFCIAIVHPFVTAQDDDTLHTDQFRVSRPYLEPRWYEDHVERNGLSVTFTSMHRPLTAYAEALFEHGLTITALREHGDRAVPWLLVLRAEKRARPS